MESGTTAAASAEAPRSPTAKRLAAALPAAGRRASAASVALANGPRPPMAAAVAMMIAMLTTLAAIEPVMASTRSRGYSSGPMPLSTTAAAWYSCM